MKLRTYLALTIVAIASTHLHAVEPVSLFDGKTLNGWQRQGGLAEYRVEDGMIIGKTVKNAGNTFLCTTKHYADFELTFEVKFLGTPVNSGCQIRSLVRKEDGEERYMKKGSVYGPQVEIEASGPNGSESGNIYGQGLGTDFLKPKVGRVKAIRDTEWNHIRILTKGPRIRTWINGEAIADITNEEIYQNHSSGMIGLQVHGVKNFTVPYEIAWRNIRIIELNGAAVSSDPKDQSTLKDTQARLAACEKILIDPHEDIGVRLRAVRDVATLTNTDVFEVAQRIEQLQRHLSRGEMANHLACFNLFEEKPEAVQRLYTTAYRLLEAETNASYSDLADDPTIQRIFREIGMTHFGGPMLGAVSSDGDRVWIRTLRPGKVTVRVMVDGKEETFGPANSSKESDLTAIIPVTGLKPNTSYRYRVLVNDIPIKMPETAELVTAPENEKVRIAFGSCFHRWGIGNQALSDMIRSRHPAAMLLVGDIAAQDRNNHIGLHRSDYLMRDLQPAWQDLVATVPVYATWDDHDYFDNDKSGIPPGNPEKGIPGHTDADRRAVWSVFRECWNNPSYGFGEQGQGVFLRTRIGPCDIIMTDNRYFREHEEGSFLGDEQMKWLKEQLLDCKAPFIILSCGTMWSDYVSGGKDSWGKWDPEGREEIFSFIEKNRIGGVLLISGDRHGARGFEISRPSGFTFYEFEPASLGGRWGPGVKPRKSQLFGFDRQCAFGEFSFDTTLADPEVTFQLIQDNGTVMYKLTLKRSQLTPAGN